MVLGAIALRWPLVLIWSRNAFSPGVGSVANPDGEDGVDPAIVVGGPRYGGCWFCCSTGLVTGTAGGTKATSNGLFLAEAG